MKRITISTVLAVLLLPTAVFAAVSGYYGELDASYSGATLVYNCGETYGNTAVDDTMDNIDGTFTPLTAESGFTNGRSGFGSGYFGGGLFFNSDGSSIEINDTLTPSNINKFVMQFWVMWNGSQWNQLMFNDSGALQMYTAGYFEVLFYSGSNHYARTVNNISTGVWTHVAVVYDGSGDTSMIDIYFNDVKQTLTAGQNGQWAGSSTYAGSGKIKFGGPAIGAKKMHGWVDDVSITWGDSTLTEGPPLTLVQSGFYGELGPGSNVDRVYKCEETYGDTRMDDAMDNSDATFNPQTADSGFTTGRSGFGSGYFGGGLFFNNDGSYVEMDSPMSPSGTTKYVLQCWVKFNGSQWNQRLFDNGGHLAVTTAGYLEVLHFSAGNHYARCAIERHQVALACARAADHVAASAILHNHAARRVWQARSARHVGPDVVGPDRVADRAAPAYQHTD